MKIRIQDNSVRFRISMSELETLLANGLIESRTEMVSPQTKQCVGRFIYGIKRLPGVAESACEIEPGSIWLLLNDADCEKLSDPRKEGVYLRVETEIEPGVVHRFMSFVEKDRPATHCDKPELWIYNYQSNQTVPIDMS